jgi:DNA-binding NarL/FixJ family response regulator
MDIEMKGLDGIQISQNIKKQYPDIKIVILTMHSEEEYLFEAIKAGVDAYILKEFSAELLFEAIKEVNSGRSLLDPLNTQRLLKAMGKVLQKQIRPQEKPTLSKREIQILILIEKGYTNKLIAEELFISEATVRNHITNIFFKLKCGTRIAAIFNARYLGLID